MKSYILIAILFSVSAKGSAALEPQPDPRAAKVDWNSDRIHVIEKGDAVEIVLASGGAACFRLIHAEVTHYANDPFATLEYQILRTHLRSTRNMENFFVRWILTKKEFDKLRAERGFYILRKDDAIVDVEEALLIKAEAQRIAAEKVTRP